MYQEISNESMSAEEAQYGVILPCNREAHRKMPGCTPHPGKPSRIPAKEFLG